MAWNGSNSKATVKTQKRETPSVISHRYDKRVLLIALIVVLICGGVILFMRSEKNKMTPVVVEPPKKCHVISLSTNIAKAVKRKSEEPVVKSARGRIIPKENLETYVDSAGVLRYKKGNARVRKPDDFKNPIILSSNSNIPEFRHRVESEIATLITLEPGDTLVGEVDYRNMNQDFVDSLVDKIDFNENDTPYAKQVKESVIEVKKELAQRVKNGENLIEILQEARAEQMRSAQYKDELRMIINEQRENPDLSDEDLKTTLEAANKMLEARGIAPIKDGQFLRQRQRLIRIREKKALESTSTLEQP